MKFVMRPALPKDAAAVIRIILARSEWLEKRDMPSWRGSAEKLAALTSNEDGSMFLLEADGQPVGCTTVTDSTPPMAWTQEELAEPSLYLYSTITDPVIRGANPGALIALWAIDRAALEGKRWVRRGCRFSGLVTYYERQGFRVVHEMQKTNGPMYLMGRHAERIEDLEDRLNGVLSPFG
ncbi:GNAT family N-acetyltransferase [Streptomyces albipurpureus]|uniref:GNAT family N-acetyltransferase n=1 Tax=Streptomyces albipurpureus TaxID=2897419 RepID=A0ABT0UNE0_9ACTN|nr:GNAT family N-acetyltransferase [Streptomyces sp. CWNU-1]MCM2390132.1 GNAT family N-acetyltransferase [Streptomyces sp. CWNU-1]